MLATLAKKLAFGLGVTATFFALVELILMSFGVVPLSERSDPYVGFSGYAPLFQKHDPPGAEPFYETAHNKIRWFNHQRFPATKAEGTIRIFCMGGSTTYVRPYDDRTSFCGWLRLFLQEADPTRQWEVINAGGISYASYRVSRLMEELSDYDPDLFIIYSGHNEFLEQRTYDKVLWTPEFVRDLGSLASRLRLYSALYDVSYESGAVLPAEVKAVLDRSVGPDDYHRDDEMRDAVLDHFQISLTLMTHISVRAQAASILVTPASNLGDFSPFKSEPDSMLGTYAIGQVDSLKTEATAALNKDDSAGALAICDRAIGLDGRNADLLYLRARALRALGRVDMARKTFALARDEDVCPLRAVTRIEGIVEVVARSRATGLVDFSRLVKEKSTDGIPGSNLFLDHVHPTNEGNRELALALIQEMATMGIVSPAVTWNADVITRISEQLESSLDKEAHALALKNLSRVLMWAGKHEEAARLVDQAVTETSEDGETHFQKVTLLRRAGDNEGALLHYREAARLSPWNAPVRHALGVLLSEFGRKSEARAELETAIRLDKTQVDAHYDLGVVLDALGEGKQAEALYRTTLALDPTHAVNLPRKSGHDEKVIL
jgi:Flp pilus assembly protein TadD